MANGDIIFQMDCIRKLDSEKTKKKELKLSVPVKKKGWIDGVFLNLMEFDSSIKDSNLWFRLNEMNVSI